MPQKYTLEYLKNNKVAVNCRTVSDLRKVCAILCPQWGYDLIDDVWNAYEQKSCIGYIDKSFVHWNINCFTIIEKYKIIHASDFLKDWEDESKATPIADIIVKGDGGFEFIDHTNATTIAAIRTHLAEIDNLLKTIK